MPTSRSNKPTVIITIGDPSGIGPEVVLKSLASSKVSGIADFLVIGDKFVIEKIKNDLALQINVPILNLSNISSKDFLYGKCRASFGKASLEYVDTALEILKKERPPSALVTAPANKASIRQAGHSDFKGHTEHLARKTGAKECAMMFVGKGLRVTLVTRHIALREVPKHLSIEAISKAIVLTHKYLKIFFKISNPKIGVSGLNPHSGENGIFGDEEKNIIIPAIKKTARHIKGIFGPIPPDVVFYQALKKKFDAVIAMYHDQGLIPFKLLYFNSGVNLTLGLPFVRTSPDHGTAFDIAGKGIADPTSMIEAISLACRLSSGKTARMRCLPSAS